MAGFQRMAPVTTTYSQRGGAGGACLLAGEPVVLAGGEVMEPGGEHGVVWQGRPHRAPGRQPQLGSVASGQ